MDDTTEDQTTEASRRTVLGAAAVLGVGAVLAACGGEDTPTVVDTGPAMKGPTTTPPGTPVGKASAVPVGSGIISDRAKAVVTQPEAGEFKAFDSTCTHRGCMVKKIEGDTITCPCHGSQFSTVDGSVKHGPATRGLTPVRVVQEDGELFIQG